MGSVSTRVCFLGGWSEGNSTEEYEHHIGFTTRERFVYGVPDPELYLAEIISVMPYWPRQCYLELCPRYWLTTRARLDPRELELPIGHITVPSAAAAE